MTIFESIVGHQRQKKILLQSELHHAYLLSGPSGVGKKLFALATAERILCEAEQNQPCGQCPSCISFRGQKHPDLYMVTPTEGLHKVEVAREILSFIELKSLRGRGKVVIIDDAHKLNIQSANTLLKSLEEPPDGVRFFLIAPSIGSLLPTIQSRCLKISFGHLSAEELKEIFPQAPREALLLSQGRADMVQFWKDDSQMELRKSFLTLMEALPHSAIHSGFEGVSKMAEEKTSAQTAVVIAQSWLKSLCLLKLNIPQELPFGETERITNSAKHFTLDSLILLFQKAQRLEQDISSHVQRKLAFENFWLDIKSEMIQPTSFET